MAEILKVSSTSDPSATAGALANTIREEGLAELQAIGPKAVNQAVKAITIARGYMAPSGVDLVFVPSFVDVQIDEEKKTAMRMRVQTRLPFKSKKDELEEKESDVEVKDRSNDGGETTDEQPDPEDRKAGGGEDDILDI